MFRGAIPGFADDHDDVEQRLISKNDWYVYNLHSQFIFGCYSGEKRLVSTLRLVHHSHHELAVSHSRRAGPSQPGPARPCQGLKVDMRIALRRRGGPSVLASSINIVHALFVYFLLIVAIICTIYRSTNFIYYWEICIFAPIIAKYLLEW